MSLWIVLAALTLAAAMSVIAPLMRSGGRSAPRRDYDLAVYRDQLREVERDAAAGAISSDEAEAARLEVERRMLAVAATPKTEKPARSDRSHGATGLAVAAFIALGAAGLYLSIGRPDLPDQPLAVRLAAMAEQEQRAQEFADLVDQLADRLAERPEDAAGWRLLANSYATLGRYGDAAAAYAQAAQRQEGDADLWSSYGEALVLARNGEVGTEARQAFDRALALDAADPRARFFIGLAKAQAGDRQSALSDWTALLDGAPADAPWRADVQRRIRALRAQDAGSAADILPGAGPSAQDMADAAALDPEARAAMIRGMVDGLARRLEANPRDAEGWIRLARSRLVLGEDDAARDAISRAMAVFAEEPETQRRIAAVARELGIGERAGD